MAKADTKGTNGGTLTSPFEDAAMKKGGGMGSKSGKKSGK